MVLIIPKKQKNNSDTNKKYGFLDGVHIFAPHNCKT